VIVDCALYRDGVRVTPTGQIADIHAAVEDATEPNEFVWLGLFEPNRDEMDDVSKTFSLHRLAIEDAVKAHQRPKLERYHEGHLFMVLKTLWYVDAEDAVETGEIAVFLGHNYVVTVRHGEGAGLAMTRKGLEESTAILGHGPFAVLYSICDRVVDTYEKVATELETDVDEVETAVFAAVGTSQSHRIYTLKRELAEFRRAVGPLREPLARFAERQVAGMPREAAAFFRDVADHSLRVYEQVESLDSLLTSAHDAYQARISTQQNDDMRKISAWVAIAALPTALAGIYGMNFDNMPELRWEFGYPAVLLVMLSFCIMLYILFRRSGWL
jgi:magnesium transporter